MKQLIISFVFVLMTIFSRSQESDLTTYYEKSGFKATPSYDETISFCKLLDESSSQIYYTTFGKTPQGRDLPLLIIDADGYKDPWGSFGSKAKGKLIVLIQAGIHPGEIDGKDAGLMFFRDIAIKGLEGGIPKNITFLFIPIFNADGHERFGPYNRINQDGPEEMGWRTTAQNLNLNRDFLKADAPEMQSWLNLWHKWKPDFLADIHVTDGADYQYVMTYGLETHGNMDAGLTKWTEEQFVPAMESFMDQSGYPAFPYVMFRRWHDPRSGLRSSAGGPRYSQGYAATQNRIGLLVENHSLKDYQTRVSGTYELLRFLNDYLSNNAESILILNANADNHASSASFLSVPFAVDYKAGPDSVMVDFRGVEYDVVKSDLTGGDWFIYHPDKPVSFKVPYFNQQLPAALVTLPEAYIIPPEWNFMVDKLVLHDIQFSRLEKPREIQVESIKFTGVEYGKSSYEGRTQVKAAYEPFTETKEFAAGSVIVPTRQPGARVIAHMMEPASPDSYLQWGFFNVIFELKEYFETYKMEEYARKMLAENPEMKEGFEKWKLDNPEAAKSQWSQLEWFYFRSPWVDQKRNVYPIGRILDRKTLEEIRKN